MLAVEVDTPLPTPHVVRVLERLLLERCLPKGGAPSRWATVAMG